MEQESESRRWRLELQEIISRVRLKFKPLADFFESIELFKREKK